MKPYEEKVIDFDKLQELMEKAPEIAVFAPKKMVDEAEKQIEKKLKSVMGRASALNANVTELKEIIENVKNEDVSRYALKVKNNCDSELAKRLWSLETEYKNKAEKIDAEIRKKEKELEKLEPTAKYYSTIVGSVLDAVKERGYELTSENVTEIICKTLDVASYQKWQEIKGENWGKNSNENKKTRLSF